MSDPKLLPNYTTIKTIIQQPTTVETLFELPSDQIEFLIDECDIFLKEMKNKFMEDFEKLKPYLVQLKELKCMIDKLREKRNAYSTFINMDRADCWLAMDYNHDTPFPIKMLEEKYEIYKSKKSPQHPTSPQEKKIHCRNKSLSPSSSKDDISIITEMKKNKQRSELISRKKSSPCSNSGGNSTTFMSYDRFNISPQNTTPDSLPHSPPAQNSIHNNTTSNFSPPLPNFQPSYFQKNNINRIEPQTEKIPKKNSVINNTSKIPTSFSNHTDTLSKTISYLPQPKFIRSNSILKKST